MTQARQPAFFAGHGVHDTPEGRTSVLILLLFPVLERLQAAAGERRLARLLTETFITDIDDCLREMGVGDLSVPKKVKRAAQALGERCLAYRKAAAGSEPAAALARELATTLPGLDQAAPARAEALARWTLRAVADIAAAPLETLRAGRVPFPASPPAPAPAASLGGAAPGPA